MNPFNPPLPPKSVVDPSGTVINVPQYPRIRAWSYSVVNQHAKCPQAVKFRKIDHLPEPDSEVIDRGKRIHDELAHLIKTGEFPEGAIIPHREEWRRRLVHLHVAGAKAELQHAFDKDWNTVPWFGANVWGRVVIDGLLVAGGLASVHEHKTGKVYPEHEKQERLYALCAFKMLPTVDQVLVQCNYIDIPDKAADVKSFDRSVENDLEKEFTDFCTPLLTDDIYPAAPGTHCRWCHFRKSNAGPCAFG